MARHMPQVLDDIGTAAVRLVAVQGYEATTLAQIAAEVGLSKSALLYHFNSKEELLSQALEGPARELRVFFAAAANWSPAELLAGFVDLVVTHRYEVLVFVRFNRQITALPSIQKVSHLIDDVVGLFVAEGAPLDRRVAVHLALGGIVETVLNFLDVPDDELRAALIPAAAGALGSVPDSKIADVTIADGDDERRSSDGG
jgi:AcrR family transcriptional regulator